MADEPVMLPESCLIAVDKAGPGVWRCVHGHMHIDVRTVLQAKGIENPSQDDLDRLTAMLKVAIPEMIPELAVNKAIIEE